MSRDCTQATAVEVRKKPADRGCLAWHRPGGELCFGPGYEVFGRAYRVLFDPAPPLYGCFELPLANCGAANFSGRRSMKTVACALLIAALPAVAAAAERPDWAFPPSGVTNAPRKPETGELKHVPDSNK